MNDSVPFHAGAILIQRIGFQRLCSFFPRSIYLPRPQCLTNHHRSIALTRINSTPRTLELRKHRLLNQACGTYFSRWARRCLLAQTRILRVDGEKACRSERKRFFHVVGCTGWKTQTPTDLKNASCGPDSADFSCVWYMMEQKGLLG